jgi:hypothetical protein
MSDATREALRGAVCALRAYAGLGLYTQYHLAAWRLGQAGGQPPPLERESCRRLADRLEGELAAEGGEVEIRLAP